MALAVVDAVTSVGKALPNDDFDGTGGGLLPPGAVDGFALPPLFDTGRPRRPSHSEKRPPPMSPLSPLLLLVRVRCIPMTH